LLSIQFCLDFEGEILNVYHHLMRLGWLILSLLSVMWLPTGPARFIRLAMKLGLFGKISGIPSLSECSTAFKQFFCPAVGG